MIRYHRSLNHKLCRQGIGGVSLCLHQHLMRNHKSLGSGGSMVARLKLKEIDGRAPPGKKSDSVQKNHCLFVLFEYSVTL